MPNAGKMDAGMLFQRRTFSFLIKKDVSPGAKILSGGFALLIRPINDNKIKPEALLVVEGHKDKLKKIMVSTPQTIQLSST